MEMNGKKTTEQNRRKRKGFLAAILESMTKTGGCCGSGGDCCGTSKPESADRKNDK